MKVTILMITCMSLAHAAEAAAAAASPAEESPSVTPYRPSVSTPAALSAPGWFEVETGGQRLDGGGAAARDSLPYSIKYALSEDWGIRVGGEALVHAPRAGTGLGDTSVVVKRRFALDEGHALGLELGATFATANDALHSGSGSTDFNINSIYSADLDAQLHTDINLVMTRQGTHAAGTGRMQWLLAAALSGPLNGQWGWVGEFSGTRQSGVSKAGQFLGAASYSPARNVSWDFGAARGLTSASPRWSWFGGVTFLAAKS